MPVMTISMAMHGQTPSTPENTAPQDSTINVIAWFNKRDTVTYRVNESSWKLNGTDTILTASYSMMVRINVVDSTSNGYKNHNTIMYFHTDKLTYSSYSIEKFKNKITDKLTILYIQI